MHIPQFPLRLLDVNTTRVPADPQVKVDLGSLVSVNSAYAACHTPAMRGLVYVCSVGRVYMWDILGARRATSYLIVHDPYVPL